MSQGLRLRSTQGILEERAQNEGGAETPCGEISGEIILEERVGVCHEDRGEKEGKKPRVEGAGGQILEVGVEMGVSLQPGQMAGAQGLTRSAASRTQGRALNTRLGSLGFPLRVLGSHGMLLRRGV